MFVPDKVKVPEPFWVLEPTLDAPNLAEGELIARWKRTRLFDEEVARALFKIVNDAGAFVVCSLDVKSELRVRPGGLNTVEMLKAASAGLGMGAHRAMQVAERLYMAGHISYPRTESTAYPKGFALKETLRTQKSHPVWGGFVAKLLDDGLDCRRVYTN